MTTSTLHFKSSADLAQAIVLAERQGAHGFTHLARGMAAGRITFQPLTGDLSASRFKAFGRLTRDRPVVGLIGDDDGLDRGPVGWPIAQRAITWTRACMIHAAAAEIVHYEAAIVAAELCGRCLVVECSSATLPAWMALETAAPHRPRTMIVRTREGVPPLSMARGALH
jgi:hypothetical protein